MSKPAFNLEGPFPRLTVELPLCHPRECHQCGALTNLRRWQEHDTADNPECRYTVLCQKCSDAIIEEHPRLYRALDENEPAPGAMPICLNCIHRAGSQCWHPRSWLRGPSDLKLFYPSPTRGFMDYAGKRGRREGGPFTIFHGPVYNCSGKELDGPVLPA